VTPGHMNMYQILNGYRDTAVLISRSNSIRFLFLGLDKVRRLQKTRGYTRRIVRPHSVCCWSHKET